MRLLKNFLGTLLPSILIDADAATAVRLKNNGGVLEARNKADDGLIKVSAASPTGNDHVVTKAYADTNYAQGQGAIRTLKVPFDYEDAGTPVDSTFQIPINADVVETAVVITTAFDGDSPTVNVGTAADDDLLLDEADIDATQAGVTVSEDIINFAGNAAVRVSVAIGGSPSQGQGYALVKFAVPLT